MDSPPVSTHLRSFILSEIQNIGPTCRLQPNSSSSLFRTIIPLDHPHSHLHTLSIHTILQAISPRKLAAWTSFKIFHRAHNSRLFPSSPSSQYPPSSLTYNIPIQLNQDLPKSTSAAAISFTNSSTANNAPTYQILRFFSSSKVYTKPTPTPIQTPDNP